MGPLRFRKGDLYKTFKRITSKKGHPSYDDLFGWKGLVKITFNSPFLNFKGPILQDH